MNRIFISYRSSDGAKDAARLAGDLNLRYGDDQIFYDKEDLVGGSSWRAAINATLGSRPVVLVLVTPDLFGAPHPDGGCRIDREDDPIRNELLAAEQNGAVVIPLLTEGMTMPSAQDLPPGIRFFTEAHAQRLRTHDWHTDLKRVITDLRAHGIQPRPAPPDDDDPVPDVKKPTVLQRMQRWLMYFGAAMALLLVIALLLPDDPDVPSAAEDKVGGVPLPPAANGPSGPAAPTSRADASGDISGVWWSVDAVGHRTRVQITLYGANAVLQTDAIPVAWYPEWQAYAQRMAAQGVVFDHIEYSATGQWVNGQLSMDFDVKSTLGHGPLDTGSLTLSPSADGRQLVGQLWSNGEQSNTALQLVRRP